MPSGPTILVDYRDVSSSARPNFVDTCFGHGVYTRKGTMLFTSQLIADRFYPVIRRDVEAAPVPTRLVDRARARLVHGIAEARRFMGLFEPRPWVRRSIDGVTTVLLIVLALLARLLVAFAARRDAWRQRRSQRAEALPPRRRAGSTPGT